MSHSNRLWFRRSHDPWWDLEGTTVRRQRRIKRVVDFGILATAIAMLGVVFETRPVIGF